MPRKKIVGWEKNRLWFFEGNGITAEQWTSLPMVPPEHKSQLDAKPQSLNNGIFGSLLCFQLITQKRASISKHDKSEFGEYRRCS